MRISRKGRMLPGLVAAGICWGATGAPAALNQWTLRYSLLSAYPAGSFQDTNYLLGVAFGGGAFVALGVPGRILTSTDGALWTNQASGTANELCAATYANGLFVAIGGGGTVLSSPTGTNWIRHNSGTTNDLFGVTYAAGLFVAVGEGGTILTSPDGTNWTTVAYGSITPYLYGVTYGGGSFIAVGGGATILQSEGAIAPAQPRLGSVISISGGATQGSVIGVPGQDYDILASINLADWVPLATVTVTNENGTGRFSDPAASTFKQRYYRATVP